MQSTIARCCASSLIAIFLSLFLIGSGVAQEAAKRAETKRTPQSSNVVLGRDLIDTTKSVEDLTLRLRLVQSMRGEVDRLRASFDQTAKALPADGPKHTKLVLELKNLKSRADALRTAIQEAQDGAAAAKPRIKNERLNAQPMGNDPPQADQPVVPAPDEAVAPPPPDEEPAQPENAADQRDLLIQLVDRLAQRLVQPEAAEAPQPAPENEQRAVDDFQEQLSQLRRELEKARRTAYAELRALGSLENDLGTHESDIRSLEQRLEAAQMPILQGAPIIAGVLPLGTNFGMDLQRLQQQSESSPMPESRPIPAFDSAWAYLRHDSNDLQFEIEALEEMVSENAEQRARASERLQSLSKQMTGIESRFATVIARLQTELDEASRRKIATEETLSARDDKYNQHQINLWLVWAVLLMALAIPALFLLFRFYNPPILALLVNERIFIEILSMAFLLLAIIILGTGSIITGEGLAGLLGTIAGYIFARKTLDNRGDAGAADDLGQAIAAQEAEVERLESELRGPATGRTLQQVERHIHCVRRRMDEASPRERMQLREELAQLEVERERLQRPAPEAAAAQPAPENAADPRVREQLKRAREELEMLKSVERRRRQGR